MLVGLPDQTESVGTPSAVIGYIHTKVPEAGDPFWRVQDPVPNCGKAEEKSRKSRRT